MLVDRTPRSLENNEEARAFLQQRVALFWKVMCFLMLFATALAAFGAMKKPGGTDLLIDFALAVHADACWADAPGSIGGPRTIAVDGRLRAPAV